MFIQKVPFKAVPGFSKIQSDYLEQNNSIFKESIDHTFTLESFKNQLEAKKSFSQKDRKLLVELIENQYQQIGVQKDVSILLNPNTFTITTGHQLNIFTGPAYYIYKIITIINLSKKLKEAYPDYHFVPLFWLATEDHDFEEINHFTLFNKEYKWETNQTGPVGRFHLEGLGEILNELKDLPAIFQKAYSSNNLSESIRILINGLFEQYGLICLDADDSKLKKKLVPIIKKEIFEQASQSIIQKKLNQFSSEGYEIKLFPREINFFYMESGIRERIVQEGEHFRVNQTDRVFTPQELENLIDEHPEKFSPNVVFRPVFQELILPNLAYIGGPGEIAYWLSLKGVFKLHEIPFPILAPRNSVFVLPSKLKNKMDQLNKPLEYFFQTDQEIKDNYLKENSEVAFELDEEIKALEALFNQILEKGIQLDKTMEGPILGEKQKILHSIQNLEKKLKKAEERKHETALNQLYQIKNRLFPDGRWQERKENFLNFSINHPEFMDELIQELDPFDLKVNFIYL